MTSPRSPGSRAARASVVCAASLLAGTVSAQRMDFSKVEIRATALAPNLFMLSGGGGNMALLVGDDGAVLVDDQFAELVPKVRAQVALLTDRPIRFVVNTHWHFDHTGGNEPLGRAGSVIVAHENTRKRLSTRQVVDFFDVETPPPQAALPVLTFADATTLHLNGEEVRAQHVANAHTDTDIVLHFRNRDVVHMGDVFVVGFYPFIDMGSGGTIDGVIAAVDRVLAQTTDKTRIIPGHGPMATRKDLQDYRDMLVTVRGRVAASIRKGRTQAQVLEAAPTREFDERYGRGAMKADVWLQRVYVDLARSLRKGSGG